MTDLAFNWIEGRADIIVGVDDVVMAGGLESAIMLSLFMDARADEGDVLPEGETKRRGWWGDQFSDHTSDITGSKLWLLWREKRTNETLQRAQRYSEQALAWLVADGVAKQVSVATSFETVATVAGSDANDANKHDWVLVIAVQVDKPSGTREFFRYAYQWQQQALVS